MKATGFINTKLNPNVVSITREKFEKNISTISKMPDVENYLSKFKDGTYQIVMDRQELSKRKEELLELLEKSGYLPSSKVREGLYSELGMQQRIVHPNALPVAILHDNKIIGCVFLFFYGNNTRIYVHDLTLAEEFRHNNAGGKHEHFGQAFFAKLYELVSIQYPNVQKLWLIGGGDANTAKLREHIYKEKLGAESIVNLEDDPNSGMYINFKPPGPQLLNAGQRENKQSEIKYTDGHSVKLFLAKPATLSKNDLMRIERLEQQELMTRESQRIQQNQETEKNRLSVSIKALQSLESGITTSPSIKQVLEEKTEEKIQENLSEKTPTNQ